jgi:hypothetical protein
VKCSECRECELRIANFAKKAGAAEQSVANCEFCELLPSGRIISFIQANAKEAKYANPEDGEQKRINSSKGSANCELRILRR